MVYHKRYMVTLTVPKTFLTTLPQFATPQTKSRQKKAAEKKSGATSIAGSKTASPAPDSKSKDTNAKVTKPKSTQKAKTWVKKPLQFKTFSGFKVKYVTWRQKEPRKESKAKAEAKAEKAEAKSEAERTEKDKAGAAENAITEGKDNTPALQTVDESVTETEPKIEPPAEIEMPAM